MNELLASILAILPVCAPDVHQDTMMALIQTESGFNQYAIAVVDKDFQAFSQPKNFDEAKTLIDTLEAQNKNYSVGLGQINKSNFERFKVNGLDLLEPCLNLKVSQAILKECFIRSGNNLNDALSCYYSGNFKTGYQTQKGKDSYVATVHNNGQRTLIPSIKEHTYRDKPKNPNTTDSLKEVAKIKTPARIMSPTTPVKNITLVHE